MAADAVEQRKRVLRREMRARRRALSAAEQRAAGLALAARLRSLLGPLAFRRIAAYLPNDGEIDPLPALYWFRATGRQCFVPVLYPARRHRLMFAEWAPQAATRPNRFGIPEPVVARRSWHTAQQMDWILVPLVAFDDSGARLGMGGGFYDTSLAPLRGRRHWHRPRLLGLAHEFQCVDRVATASWDVPLQGVVTDRGFHRGAGS